MSGNYSTLLCHNTDAVLDCSLQSICKCIENIGQDEQTFEQKILIMFLHINLIIALAEKQEN